MTENQVKKKLEEMVRRHGYAPKYQVEVMGRKIDVPVKYSDVSALMVFSHNNSEKRHTPFYLSLTEKTRGI